jgi:hypothetical protein
MNIDLRRFILLFLPMSLRNKSILEFIRSLAVEVQRIYDRFRLFALDVKYRANANASVISLEHHIEREFDAKATITELSGKPTDFIVVIDGNVDEDRLKGLIDSYKLFGKSYVFRTNSVDFTSRWINHVCENMSTEFISRWINHVCENKEVIAISHTLYVDPGSFSIQVSSSKSVYSDIHFTVLVYYYIQGGGGILQTTEGTGLISAGNSSAPTLYIQHPGNIFGDAVTSDIVILDGEDERYYYRKQQ